MAIHLDRSVNEGLALDRQRQTQPIWSLGDREQGALLRRIAYEADLEPTEILGWDLMLHDIQAPGHLGAEREFLVSVAPGQPGVRARGRHRADGGDRRLVAGRRAPSRSGFRCSPPSTTRRCGSGSETGAQSPLLERVLNRSVAARGGSGEDWSRAMAGALCVSADMSHAVHPNYSERHDPDNHPLPNGGPVVKVNVNQRYATDGTGFAAFVAACERAGVPWQRFVSNNAMACGTSIGPITAARLGVTTVDVGVPGLSMHSARELVGARDPGHLARALTEFVTAG